MQKFFQWAVYGALDPGLLDEVQARQQRLLRYTQWLLISLILIFWVMAWVQWVPVRLVGLSIALGLSLWGLLAVNWHRVAPHLSMAAVGVAIVIGCYSNGGLGSVASAWLLYLPLIAGVMGGMALAKVWIGVDIAIMLTLWGLSASGFVFPDLTPEYFKQRQDTLQQFVQLVGVVLALAGLIGQVEASEQAMKATIRSLKEEMRARVIAEQTAGAALARQQAFFTSMSHELRTPLNAIIGFARMLMQRKEGAAFSARDLDSVARIKTNGMDLLALVNQLLALRKSGDSEGLLHRETVDLGTLLAQVCGDLRSLVRKGVALQVKTAAPVTLETDTGLLHRILVNLVGNALKFTGQGSVTVGLEARENYVVISVTDTGPGIAEEDVAVLFEPFTRGVGREETEGSGLGLALSQQWAGMLGGTITVESTYGSGSRFCLELPLQ
ncbi:sensor histidine kinase [Simiduia agarivorans]|uniref:histidine kinase n=1 Tax=Simiduia agarivorans (strain DSM 21679 / JCM 13881 / BCRC 17597 / SA1) TaxID=1117647 RepID=K4KTG6_SIMAS|nr:HAMP domain-containing sensor histidine kinase [Simiduia agarivorans]AFU97252.2 PAS/PAC sensor signal transduction histidine kinase [Simiduia agarivorans SA1 = DSM 21679]